VSGSREGRIKVAESRDPFEDWPNKRTYQYYGAEEMDGWRRRWEPVIREWREKAEKHDVVAAYATKEKIELTRRLEAVKKIFYAFPRVIGMYEENFESKYGNFIEEYEICLNELRAAVEGSQTEEKEVRRSG
jgi:hypothetical protein